MGRKKKGMEVFILLDRTGSMITLWDEAVSSVNTYVKELAKDGANDNVTLAVFDHYNEKMQFDILRDSVSIKEWNEVDKYEVEPRGMTPLFDAFSKIVAKAEEKNNGKTAIVVMTDGYENASREVTKEAVKKLVDKVEKNKWQINFLGANFDASEQASQIGIGQNVTMNFAYGCAPAAMVSTAHTHSTYRGTGTISSYTSEDRINSKEEEVS